MEWARGGKKNNQLKMAKENTVQSHEQWCAQKFINNYKTIMVVIFTRVPALEINLQYQEDEHLIPNGGETIYRNFPGYILHNTDVRSISLYSFICIY